MADSTYMEDNDLDNDSLTDDDLADDLLIEEDAVLERYPERLSPRSANRKRDIEDYFDRQQLKSLEDWFSNL